MYKLVAIDIDGTLLDKEKKISKVTKETINAISNHCKIVLISSRMPKAMRYLQQDMNILDMPLVAFNGGLVLHKNKILSHTGIDFKTFRQILDKNNNFGLHLSLYHNDDWFAPQEDFWTKRERINTRVEPVIQSNESVYHDWQKYNKEPHKIMCMGDEAKVEEFYKSLASLENKSLHLYRSKPTYIEISPLQVSKFTGLKILLSRIYQNFSLEEILAYGDNYNDIEMLDKCGLGVAVGNAKQEVLDASDEVTLSNVDDGVAIHLQKIFKLKF